jgi:squalene-hopene/tetraprenyl-beta-curcumene cyclase
MGVALDERLDAVERAARATRDYLLSIQKDDGHWCGELEGDSILESEYVMAMAVLGRASEAKVQKAGNYLRRKQLTEGGWAIYPGGPADVSASTKAYFVLKLLGDDPDALHMVRARRKILELGGIEACNSFTKIYLALFGQYDWNKCPAIPPEIILLPRWFYINIYEMSSWSRAIFVPLSIVWSHRPTREVPSHANISELNAATTVRRPPGLWSSLFHGLDRGLKLHEKLLERLPIKHYREYALKRAEAWILERLEHSDGLGAIFPPIVNTIFALSCLGYRQDHPTMKGQIRELEKLEIEDDDTLRVQPCFSPVWDTALTLNALIEAGHPADDPAVLEATRWLLDKRGNGEGDWRVKNRLGGKPGWYFEYANPHYPDCDTTSQVITALSKVRCPDPAEAASVETSLQQAGQWHMSMQNNDGGWGAFDRKCDKEILAFVPFADHNAMIDPSTADLTARALETYACLGFDRDHPPLRRAIRYLYDQQDEDGSWYGRWGCNYLYGTWLAVWGLKCIGEDTGAEWARRARAWLADCQNEDGGWGELPLSYEDARHKGKGPSTASQTAWALLGLMAAGETDSESLRRGIDFLLREQNDDGSWSEEYWTGTGFPGVFYLRYHLYATYFPLLALADYRRTSTNSTNRGVSPRS